MTISCISIGTKPLLKQALPYRQWDLEEYMYTPMPVCKNLNALIFIKCKWNLSIETDDFFSKWTINQL